MKTLEQSNIKTIDLEDLSEEICECIGDLEHSQLVFEDGILEFKFVSSEIYEEYNNEDYFIAKIEDNCFAYYRKYYFDRIQEYKAQGLMQWNQN